MDYSDRKPGNETMQQPSTERSSHLSMRESKVLQLVASGLSNKEIAAKMGISASTVKRPVENFFRKLLLENRVEAAVYAVKVGVVTSGKDKS
jgi:two-component system NarL family response regulator